MPILVALLLALGSGGCETSRKAGAWWPGEAGPPLPPPGALASQDVPPPRGLRASSGELRAVPLRWDPPLGGDVGGYLVERAPTEDGPFERIATVAGRFQTAFVDRGADRSQDEGLGDGRVYHYRLRSFRSDAAVGLESSNPVAATTAPPPRPPPGIRAFSRLPRQVALSWEAAEDPFVTAYVVYRSPSARGEFLPVETLSGRHATAWVDTELGALRVFYYRVASVNAAGGEGEASEPVRAVTKPEPLPPIGLEAEAEELGVNTLRWEPNVERDIVSYRLLRMRQGRRNPELVVTTDAGVTEARDPAVGAGEHVGYQLVAVDADGLESAPSDAVEVDSVGYGLRAEETPGGVHLRWDPALQQRFAGARVLRKGLLRTRELGRVETEGFLDTDVRPGRRYRYVVVMLREDGSDAPASRPVEVETPQGPPQDAPEPATAAETSSSPPPGPPIR